MRHGTSPLARALVAAGLAVAFAPLAATASYAGARQEKPIEVLGTKDNKFDPADVEATPDADGNVTVEFTAEAGGAPHTWENKSLDIDTGIVPAGETKKITFKAPAAGQHKIICSLHQPAMVGTLTIAEGAQESPDASPSSQPPASASASATSGDGTDNAPTAPAEGEHEEGEEEGHPEIPGVEGNETLEKIEAERAAQAGAVSGFKFFTFVCIAFLVILGAAVLFSTRPRRAGR